MIIRIRSSKGTSRLEIKEENPTIQNLFTMISKELSIPLEELQIALDFQGESLLDGKDNSSLSSVGIQHGALVYISQKTPEKNNSNSIEANNESASQEMKNNNEKNITGIMDSHKTDSAKIGMKAPDEPVSLNELDFDVDEATRAMIEKIQKEDELNNQKDDYIREPDKPKRMNLMADDLFGSRGAATNQNSYFNNDFYYQHDDSDDGDHDKYGLDAFRRSVLQPPPIPHHPNYSSNYSSQPSKPSIDPSVAKELLEAGFTEYDIMLESQRLEDEAFAQRLMQEDRYVDNFDNSDLMQARKLHQDNMRRGRERGKQSQQPQQQHGRDRGGNATHNTSSRRFVSYLDEDEDDNGKDDNNNEGKTSNGSTISTNSTNSSTTTTTGGGFSRPLSGSTSEFIDRIEKQYDQIQSRMATEIDTILDRATRRSGPSRNIPKKKKNIIRSEEYKNNIQDGDDELQEILMKEALQENEYKFDHMQPFSSSFSSSSSSSSSVAAASSSSNIASYSGIDSKRFRTDGPQISSASQSSSDMMPVFEEDNDEALQAVIEESLLTNKDDSEILKAIKMSLAESKKSNDGSNNSSDDRSYKDQSINYNRSQESNEDELIAKALQISMNDF